MQTTQTPAAPRRLLLLKATIAHQSGYYLWQGRWHKVKTNKPVPKGAPVALHPHAAGQHAPIAHLTDEQWAQLKLPDSNVNAPTFNKQLEKLKELSDAGNVTAILGSQFGTNTYGQKLAKIANHLLGLHGSQHSVAPGQKAGEHEAVKQVPAELHSAPAVNETPTETAAPAVESSTQEAGLSLPEFQEGKEKKGVKAYYDSVVAKILTMASAGDLAGVQGMVSDKGHTWKGKTPNSKLLVAFHAKVIDELKTKQPVDAPAATPEPVPAPAPEPHAEKKPEPAPSAGASAETTADKLSQVPWEAMKLPASNTNAGTFNKKIDEIKAAAVAGDLAKLEGMKFGVNTYGKKAAKIAATAIAALKETASAPEPVALPEPAQTAELSPKEGDTKEGADGTLVFHSGHWHKQKPAEPELAPAATGLDAIIIPKFTEGLTAKQTDILVNMAANLLLAAKQDGAAGLKGKIIQHKTGAKAGKITVKVGYSKASYLGGESPKQGLNEFHKFVTDLLAATGKPKKASKPKAPPAPAAPVVAPGGTPSMDSWVQTGPQGGSNPGGRFKDENGVEWYCKFPSSEDVAKSEVLAAKLYAAAGVTGQDAKLITKDGKLGIASRWVDVSKADPKKLAKSEGAFSGFAVDAWLGNWDVVGLEYDNLQIGADGKAVRVDAGGSLEYRAQGGKKAFGNTVIELDSLRDASINPQAAAVFGKMTQADIAASASKVANLSDDSIRILVNTYGPGDTEAKKALAETLIARKADIIAKYPKAKKQKVINFKPEKISAPPSFTNWGGTGKSGPSSKEFLNLANEKAVQAVYAAAKTGKVDAVQNLTAEIYNKDTGEVTGSAKVLEHPSQHVKGYAQQAINEINYQMNPPKRFRFDGGHPLHSLNAAYPSHKGPAHGSAVGKVGKYILLGEPGTVSLDALALPKLTHASGQLTKATYSPAAQAAFAKMPLTQQQAVKAYTGSGYHKMNNSLWEGNPVGEAKAAAEALHTLGHDLIPGTVLSRKISVHGSDLDALMKTTGKVIQEPAIMSTAIRPSSWSGNVQLKLHVGPGVKGLWVGHGSGKNGGSISNHGGEDEIILPPNTRMLVLSTKKSNGTDADGFGGHGYHVIEAVILPTQDHS
jgi:hypothetical protein